MNQEELLKEILSEIKAIRDDITEIKTLIRKSSSTQVISTSTKPCSTSTSITIEKSTKAAGTPPPYSYRER